MSKNKKPDRSPEFPLDITKIFNPSYFGKLTDWQEELVDFYRRRLHSYSKIAEKLAKCRDPSDVFELQSEFFTEVLSDYRNEAAVASELLFDTSRSVVKNNHEASEANCNETIQKAEKDAKHLISLAKNQAETIIEAAEARAASITSRRKRAKKVA